MFSSKTYKGSRHREMKFFLSTEDKKRPFPWLCPSICFVILIFTFQLEYCIQEKSAELINAQLSECSQTETSHVTSTQSKNRTWPAYQFLGLPKQSLTDWAAQNNRNLFWKPGVWSQGVSGLALSRDSEGEPFPCFSPRLWWQPAILGVAWLEEVSFQFLPPPSHGLLPCVFSLILIKIPVMWD